MGFEHLKGGDDAPPGAAGAGYRAAAFGTEHAVFAHPDDLAVITGPEAPDGAQGVVEVIGGIHRSFAGSFCLAAPPLGFGHLNVSGVPEHDVAEVDGLIGGVNFAPEAVFV